MNDGLRTAVVGAGVAGARLRVGVRARDGEGDVMAAAWSGVRRPLTDAELARAIVRHPAKALGRVLGPVYWHALRLRRRSGRGRLRPAGPREGIAFPGAAHVDPGRIPGHITP